MRSGEHATLTKERKMTTPFDPPSPSGEGNTSLRLGAGHPEAADVANGMADWTQTITIEWRDPQTLVPYIRNPRTHTKKQIQQIAASIRTFGFTNPVLTDDEGGIIAGHGRVEAAKLLGLTA